MPPGVLMYLEANGQLSIYLVEEEIEIYLQIAHEDHGHFTDMITLNHLVSKVYWLSQSWDI